MRLIDADELKEVVFSKTDGMEDLWDTAGVLNAINNAPTVALDESVIQEVLNKRCMTAVANEYLIALHGNGTRQQGEWKEKVETKQLGYGWLTTHEIVCSVCGKEAEWLDGGSQLLSKFCPNCGADMRGEE